MTPLATRLVVALCLGTLEAAALPKWTVAHDSLCAPGAVPDVYGTNLNACYALCNKTAGCSQFAVTNANWPQQAKTQGCNLAPPCAKQCTTSPPWRPGAGLCKMWDTYTCMSGPAAQCADRGVPPPPPPPPPTPAPPPAPPTPLVVVGSNDRFIYALRSDNGKQVWSYETNQEVTSTVASDAGNVFVGGFGGSLYALNAWNGTLLWKWDNPADPKSRPWRSAVTSPTIYKGTVYVGSMMNDQLYAIDELTGRLRWTSIHIGGGLFGPPIIYKDTVIVSNSAWTLAAFALKDGSLVWKNNRTGFLDGIVGTSLYEGSSVAPASIIVGSNGGLYSLNADTGALLWTAQTPAPHPRNGGFVSAPVVNGDLAVFGCFDFHIYAVNASNGKLKWTVPTGGAVLTKAATATIDGVALFYVGARNSELHPQAFFYAVDGAGHVRWTATGGNEFGGSPSTGGGKVFVGNDYMVSAYGAENGAGGWSFHTKSYVTSSPVLVDLPEDQAPLKFV